ncbi:MAG: hypothetical protein QM775_12735 [Pirellulales bacterium]
MKARVLVGLSTAVVSFCEWQMRAMPQNFVPLKAISALTYVAMALLFSGMFFMAKKAWDGPPKEPAAEVD